eukprot:scaffold138357_cov118-Phaeocystis_antarctica.AAC.1
MHVGRRWPHRRLPVRIRRVAVAQPWVSWLRSACVRVQQPAPNVTAPEGRPQAEVGGALQSAVLGGVC